MTNNFKDKQINARVNTPFGPIFKMFVNGAGQCDGDAKGAEILRQDRLRMLISVVGSLKKGLIPLVGHVKIPLVGYFKGRMHGQDRRAAINNFHSVLG